MLSPINQVRPAVKVPQAPTATTPSLQPSAKQSTLAGDRLVIGKATFDAIRELGPGISLEMAKRLTANNGIDEVYFQDTAGKTYVAFARGSLDNVRLDYLGNYGSKRVRVVALDDEHNTFKEGAQSLVEWVVSALGKIFNQEASKALATSVTTITGGVIAATALKGATTAPGVGIGAALKGAFAGVVNAVVNIGVPIVTISAAFLGMGALLSGANAASRPADYTTIDMISEGYSGES